MDEWNLVWKFSPVFGDDSKQAHVVISGLLSLSHAWILAGLCPMAFKTAVWVLLVVYIDYYSQWWGHWLWSAVWPLYRVLTSWCRIVWNWPGYWRLNCLSYMCKIWCFWDKNLLVYVSLDCFPEINFLLDLWLWMIFLYVYVLLFHFLIFRVLLIWKLPER